MKKSIDTTVQRRFRVALNRPDLVTLIKVGPGALFSPEFRAELPAGVEIEVDGITVDDDSPLVLSWQTTETSNA